MWGEPETCMICIDNGSYSKNEDFHISRLEAQLQAALLIGSARTEISQNESRGKKFLTGILSMGGKARLVAAPLADFADFSENIRKVVVSEGEPDIEGAFDLSLLALGRFKGRGRLVMTLCSPIGLTREKLAVIASDLNADKILFDVLVIGSDTNMRLLDPFVMSVRDSHVFHVSSCPGYGVLDDILNTPLVRISSERLDVVVNRAFGTAYDLPRRPDTEAKLIRAGVPSRLQTGLVDPTPPRNAVAVRDRWTEYGIQNSQRLPTLRQFMESAKRAQSSSGDAPEDSQWAVVLESLRTPDSEEGEGDRNVVVLLLQERGGRIDIVLPDSNQPVPSEVRSWLLRTLHLQEDSRTPSPVGMEPDPALRPVLPWGRMPTRVASQTPEAPPVSDSPTLSSFDSMRDLRELCGSLTPDEPFWVERSTPSPLGDLMPSPFICSLRRHPTSQSEEEDRDASGALSELRGSPETDSDGETLTSGHTWDGVHASSLASGLVSGIASGATSGVASGIASGQASGIASGIASGQASGTASGAASGLTSGIANSAALGSGLHASGLSVATNSVISAQSAISLLTSGLSDTTDADGDAPKTIIPPVTCAMEPKFSEPCPEIALAPLPAPDVRWETVLEPVSFTSAAPVERAVSPPLKTLSTSFSAALSPRRRLLRPSVPSPPALCDTPTLEPSSDGAASAPPCSNFPPQRPFPPHRPTILPTRPRLKCPPLSRSIPYSETFYRDSGRTTTTTTTTTVQYEQSTERAQTQFGERSYSAYDTTDGTRYDSTTESTPTQFGDWSRTTAFETTGSYESSSDRQTRTTYERADVTHGSYESTGERAQTQFGERSYERSGYDTIGEPLQFGDTTLTYGGKDSQYPYEFEYDFNAAERPRSLPPHYLPSLPNGANQTTTTTTTEEIDIEMDVEIIRRVPVILSRSQRMPSSQHMDIHLPMLHSPSARPSPRVRPTTVSHLSNGLSPRLARAQSVAQARARALGLPLSHSVSPRPPQGGLPPLASHYVSRSGQLSSGSGRLGSSISTPMYTPSPPPSQFSPSSPAPQGSVFLSSPLSSQASPTSPVFSGASSPSSSIFTPSPPTSTTTHARHAIPSPRTKRSLFAASLSESELITPRPVSPLVPHDAHLSLQRGVTLTTGGAAMFSSNALCDEPAVCVGGEVESGVFEDWVLSGQTKGDSVGSYCAPPPPPRDGDNT